MEHYFSSKPKSKPRSNIISYSYCSKEFTFETSSSIFSRNKVDKGTELLIKESNMRPKSKILDMGCGYGPVGTILSKLHPGLDITMSDINERALALAKKNIQINNIKAKVIKSNLFENIDEQFDIILSNPPQSAGKKLCFKLIEDSFDHLKNKGTLQLVARHQKGGKDLAKKMEEVFGNVKTIARKSGYHIYLSKKD
jgi:16S rRNA (guanine1207-N2)-methyltransferase